MLVSQRGKMKKSNSPKIYLVLILCLLIGVAIYKLWPYLLCLLMIYAVLYLGFIIATRMRRVGYGLITFMAVPILVSIVGLGAGFAYLGSPILLPIGGIPLLGISIYPRIRQYRLITNYKQNFEQLIQA
jgi:predicted PurR-regulated permease PerM